MVCGILMRMWCVGPLPPKRRAGPFVSGMEAISENSTTNSPPSSVLLPEVVVLCPTPYSSQPPGGVHGACRGGLRQGAGGESETGI